MWHPSLNSSTMSFFSLFISLALTGSRSQNLNYCSYLSDFMMNGNPDTSWHWEVENSWLYLCIKNLNQWNIWAEISYFSSADHQLQDSFHKNKCIIFLLKVHFFVNHEKLNLKLCSCQRNEWFFYFEMAVNTYEDWVMFLFGELSGFSLWSWHVTGS